MEAPLERGLFASGPPHHREDVGGGNVAQAAADIWIDTTRRLI
jgi:hypothetical protein